MTVSTQRRWKAAGHLTALLPAILDRAADIIEPIEHWTTNKMAVDARGRSTSPTAPNACKWCALGAVRRAASELTPHRIDEQSVSFMAESLLQDYSLRKKGKWIPTINDTRGHKTTLETIRAAADAVRDEFIYFWGS